MPGIFLWKLNLISAVDDVASAVTTLLSPPPFTSAVTLLPLAPPLVEVEMSEEPGSGSWMLLVLFEMWGSLIITRSTVWWASPAGLEEMQVKEPVSFTVLMRMSRVPLLYTNVLEEFETSLPSGEIQWITGSGSPLALHLEQNGKRNSMCVRKKNKQRNQCNKTTARGKQRVQKNSASVFYLSVLCWTLFSVVNSTQRAWSNHSKWHEPNINANEMRLDRGAEQSAYFHWRRFGPSIVQKWDLLCCVGL